MPQRTCVTSMPSALAISATNAARCSSSRRCQWCTSLSARINAVSCAADRASRSRVASDRNSCGASKGVMTCFFSSRFTRAC